MADAIIVRSGCIYLAVVLMSACPISCWIVLRFAPVVRDKVAKEWRQQCGERNRTDGSSSRNRAKKFS